MQFFPESILKIRVRIIYGCALYTGKYGIYLRCSLLSDSIIDGKRSDVLFTFPTNTKVRALPFKEHPQIDYLWNKINKKYISEVRFWLTDDKDREVDLNGIDISIAIVMKSL